MSRSVLKVVFFLTLFPKFGFGNLQCELKTKNSTILMIGEAAASGLKIHPDRSLSNLLVVSCTCDDSVSLLFIFQLSAK